MTDTNTETLREILFGLRESLFDAFQALEAGRILSKAIRDNPLLYRELRFANKRKALKEIERLVHKIKVAALAKCLDIKAVRSLHDVSQVQAMTALFKEMFDDNPALLSELGLESQEEADKILEELVHKSLISCCILLRCYLERLKSFSRTEAELMRKQIQEMVEEGRITWKEIGISKKRLDNLVNRIPHRKPFRPS